MRICGNEQWEIKLPLFTIKRGSACTFEWVEQQLPDLGHGNLPDSTNGAEQKNLEIVRTMGGRIWPPKTNEKQSPKVGRSVVKRRTEPSLDSDLVGGE